eukprot:14753407-Ditylum_brightwellii.AAC.1
MHAQKASPLLMESVKLIDSGGMKKSEDQKLSRWEDAVSERYGEFLKKLSAPRKEKGRRQFCVRTFVGICVGRCKC